MNERETSVNAEEKQRYMARYKEKKQAGELFWPDAISKDAVVSLAVFVLLLCLAIFVGVPNEPPANPNDTSYIPRPEWYFLWTFQLLKYFPGQLEGVAITGLGLLIAVGLFGLPFFDRGPKRHPFNRPFATLIMSVVVVGMVVLTILAAVSTPPQAEGGVIAADKAGQIKAGQELFAKNCAECHGAEGEGAELKNSPGTFTNPLNSEDFLKTHSADAIHQVVSFGQPGLGMQAFGVAYGGSLTDQEIRALSTFILAWGEPAAEEEATVAPVAADEELAKIEKPSFAKDIQPLLEKRCANCHSKRPKNNYSIAGYDNVLKSGTHAPLIVAGDAGASTLMKMLRGVKTPAGGQMPPSKPLSAGQIGLIERWITQGAQNN